MFINRFYIIFGIFGTILFMSSIYLTNVLYHKKNTSTQSCRVALLIPAVHPSMHQIEQGFISTLKQLLPQVKIDSFNANGDKILMKEQSNKIATSNYDAV